MIYRCMFITRERRRAKTFEYTLAVDLEAGCPEHAKRLLNERWPNKAPLPHRYGVTITETVAARYRSFTRINTTFVWNRYLPKPAH